MRVYSSIKICIGPVSDLLYDSPCKSDANLFAIATYRALMLRGFYLQLEN